jgi:hypothetical protein
MILFEILLKKIFYLARSERYKKIYIFFNAFKKIYLKNPRVFKALAGGTHAIFGLGVYPAIEFSVV